MHNISATLLNAISSPGIRVMQSVVHRNQLFKDSALDYTYADEDWLQGFPQIWVQHAKVLCTTLSLDMIVAYETAFLFFTSQSSKFSEHLLREEILP